MGRFFKISGVIAEDSKQSIAMTGIKTDFLVSFNVEVIVCVCLSVLSAMYNLLVSPLSASPSFIHMLIFHPIACLWFR